MDNQDINKAIAFLADKVSKYHERLLAVERDLKRHEENSQKHCCEDCTLKSNYSPVSLTVPGILTTRMVISLALVEAQGLPQSLQLPVACSSLSTSALQFLQ